MSQFDKYREELKVSGLSSREDLVALVKPLIRPAVKVVVQKSGRPPENSQQLSHFGGQPYFEKGEYWPLTEKGRPLDFIFQIVNTGEQLLPDHIKVVQFFYDWDMQPWDSGTPGWTVKTYEAIDPAKQLLIPRPLELPWAKYCPVSFTPIQSLPDWEGIDHYSSEASKLSCILNEDEPWGHYDEVSKELVGETEYQSIIGGYPKWLQGEATPSDDDDNNLPLLMQIDSETNADIRWGDQGLIYIFHNPATPGVYEFQLQCL